MLKQIIPLDLVKIDESGFHILVPCVLEDGNTYFFIVDTGASNTVLDREAMINFVQPARTGDYYIEDYYRKNLENSRGISDKPLHFSFGKVKLIQFKELNLKDVLFPLLDLSHIREIYSLIGYDNIIGILGSDFFIHTNALINFKEKLICLESENSTIEIL
jgi:hypothetical protein